jgi:hypothetical protein
LENNDPNSPPSVSLSSNIDFSVEEVESILKYSKVEAGSVSEKKSAALQPSIARNKISGLYSMTSGSLKLDLRIDIDGNRPMRMISGDYYNINGGTITYFGSFRIDSISLNVDQNMVTIEGIANTSWITSYQRARITIQRTLMSQPRASATIRWLNNQGQEGAVSTCQFVSVYFRRIIHEMDFEEGITPFTNYNTGSLPSGGPERVLSITTSYNEAGIDFPQITGNLISSNETQGDTWSDVELHASMVHHFSLFRELPQWSIWTISCKTYHDLGPRLLGIMFDQQGLERQGCAVFYGRIGGTSTENLRSQLYTHVHELGHCFNLMHSWQKSFADPPVPNRPSSLSWMNYPQNYPASNNQETNARIFWSLFSFQFDDLEIKHLRHAFRNNIILGGNPFTKGAALHSEQDIHLFDNPIEDHSDLHLQLKSHKQFYIQSEPVVLELKLSTKVKYDKLVHTELHPKTGFVSIGILTPGGKFVKYENLIDYLKIPETTILNDNNPAVYDSAYIGYGKDLYFDQIGEYVIRAIYHTLDGSEVLSNVLIIKVVNPLNKPDQQVANLLLGEEQGQSFYLKGLSPVLPNASNAFDTILKEYPDNTLAVYVKFIEGLTKGREFKFIEDEKIKVLKKPEPDKSIPLLEQVVEKSTKNQGLDNISANFVMRKLSQQHLLNKDRKKAQEVMDEMIGFFSKKDLNSNVINTIKTQAKETLQDHNKKI